MDGAVEVVHTKRPFTMLTSHSPISIHGFVGIDATEFLWAAVCAPITTIDLAVLIIRRVEVQNLSVVCERRWSVKTVLDLHMDTFSLSMS